MEDIFNWFTNTCTKAFKVIEEKYNYKQVVKEVNGYEILIIYRYKNERGIVIEYEYPSLPLVTIGGKYNKDGKTVSVKMSMDELIKKRCPKKSIVKLLMEITPNVNKSIPGEVQKKEVEAIMSHYTIVMEQNFEDILRGEISLL